MAIFFQNIALLGGARTFSSDSSDDSKKTKLKELFKAARAENKDFELLKKLSFRKKPKEKEKIIQAYVDFLNEIQMSYRKDSPAKPE